MTVTYLGGRSLGVAVPLFNDVLGRFVKTVEIAVDGLRSDVSALSADMAGLQADAAALAQELAEPKGLAESVVRQLADGPAAVMAALRTAVENILSGAALLALTQAIAAGPATMLAALESALAEVQAKLASIEARIGAIAGRVQGLAGRIQALEGRIAALTNLQLELGEWLGLLATSGIHAYGLAGRSRDLARELDATLSNGTPGGTPEEFAQGILLATTAGAAFTALGRVFGLR